MINHEMISRRGALALLAALAAGALAGCGGGGGGGGGVTGSPVTVTGTVLSVETGLPPSPGATVSIGGQSTTTGFDGKFTLVTSSSSTTGTVTDTAAGAQPLTVALSLSTTQANDLGSLYLSSTGYTASISGRVVTLVGGVKQPVGGARVTVANASALSNTDGTFTLAGLPAGLGATAGFYGKVVAAGFDTKAITADVIGFALVAGANRIGDAIGDLIIARPTGSIPSGPFTIQGLTTVKGVATSNVTITLYSGATNLGTTQTDSTGSYSFWVVPGAYTIQATFSGATVQQTANLVSADQPIIVPTINLVPTP